MMEHRFQIIKNQWAWAIDHKSYFPSSWVPRRVTFSRFSLSRMSASPAGLVKTRSHPQESWLRRSGVGPVVQLLSCNPLWPYGLYHSKPPRPSPSPGACSNSYPWSLWCHPTTSSSVVPFSSCLQSFPALGSFPMSQFFASGGQSIGASASASVLSMNIQDWYPLGILVWSPCCPRDSGIFYNTTFQKHQFFGAQPSLWSSSHISIICLSSKFPGGADTTAPGPQLRTTL